MMIFKTKSLTPDVYAVIIESATEPPHSGRYNRTAENGTYLCRNCGVALFRGKHKFISSCGWPSFDDEISSRILRVPDPDGRRTEIRCSNCQGHLGHVFFNEGLTQNNLRHCVNSLSIDFVCETTVDKTDEIIVAGGCFWGLEHHLAKENGVLLAESGYIGGAIPYPTYEKVSMGNTGYYEAVRLLFDLQKTNVETLYKTFFEWHDFTQKNGQGPDVGPQYKSAIFVHNTEQEHIARHLLKSLTQMGYDVATEIKSMSPFWKAEDYHQKYLIKNPSGYCSHKRRSVF